MPERTWTCQRVAAGEKCAAVNPRRLQKCQVCGKRRPATRRPAHMAALELPYEAWVEEFGEVCGICGKPPKPGKRLHRDHDHRTGERRGLCCFLCNSALRPYMTLDWLRKAVAYLERTG